MYSFVSLEMSIVNFAHVSQSSVARVTHSSHYFTRGRQTLINMYDCLQKKICRSTATTTTNVRPAPIAHAMHVRSAPINERNSYRPSTLLKRRCCIIMFYSLTHPLKCAVVKIYTQMLHVYAYAQCNGLLINKCSRTFAQNPMHTMYSH